MFAKMVALFLLALIIASPSNAQADLVLNPDRPAPFTWEDGYYVNPAYTTMACFADDAACLAPRDRKICDTKHLVIYYQNDYDADYYQIPFFTKKYVVEVGRHDLCPKARKRVDPMWPAIPLHSEGW